MRLCFLAPKNSAVPLRRVSSPLISQAAVRARICGGHVSQLPKTSQKIACFTPDYVLQYASVNILTMKLICSKVK